jgi:hypothetical protein
MHLESIRSSTYTHGDNPLSCALTCPELVVPLFELESDEPEWWRLDRLGCGEGVHLTV